MNLRTILAAVGVCLLAACGGGGSSSTTLPAGDVARGMSLVQSNNCRSCHAQDLSGSTDVIPGSMVYSSNITPDNATGIGMWTDDDLDAVIRQGKDDAGRQVCAPMPVYSQFSAQDSADVIAYLRSVPAVSREVIESECQ